MNIVDERRIGARFQGPPVVLLRLPHQLRQLLRNVGVPAAEVEEATLQAGVPVEPLRLNQVDLDRHHVGEMLSVGRRDVQDPSFHR